jgi:hypothetical protein
MKKPILTIKTSEIEESESRICSGTTEAQEKYKTKKQELYYYTIGKLKTLSECVNKCDQGSKISTRNSDICDYKDDKTKLLKISKNNIVKIIQSTDYATIDCKHGFKQINDIINENNNNIKYSELIQIFPLHILSLNHLEECLINPITKLDLESESIAGITKTDLESESIAGITKTDLESESIAGITKTDESKSKDKNIDISQKITNMYIMDKITGVTLDTFIQNMTDENKNELDYIIIQLFYILLYANINGYYHNDLKCNNIIIYYNNIHEITYNQLFNYNITIRSESPKGKSLGIPVVKLIDFFSSTFINPIREVYYITDLISILSNIEDVLNIEIKSKYNFILLLLEKLNTENLNKLINLTIGKGGWITNQFQFRLLLEEDILRQSFHFNLASLDKIFIYLQSLLLDNTNIIFHFERKSILDIKSLGEDIKKEDIKKEDIKKEDIKKEDIKKEAKKKYLKYKQKYLQLKNQIT